MSVEETRDELLQSVSRLFDNDKFSDLDVVTAKKTFHAHKNIVCPRSTYFERTLEDLEAGASKLNLEADDPEAAGRVLEFLYKLDYNSAPSQTVDTNSSNGPVKDVNGNGIHTSDEPSAPAKEVEEEPASATKGEEIAAGDSLDDFIPRAKKSKKKKRAKSTAPAPDADVIEAARAAQTSPASAQVNESLNGGAREFAPVQSTNGEEAPQKPVAKYIPSNPITVHSRVYVLSVKYEIASLKAIALARFERKAKALWNTDDFIQAAKEVYSAVRGGQDRSLKDVITRVIVQNLAAIDKEVLTEVIPGGELGLDLVMHIKTQGGIKSDTDDTWGD